MHQNLDIVVDKLATASYPDIPAEIKDWALNEAQLRIVKTRHNGNNQFEEGFQETQKITDELNVLVKTVEIIPTVISTADPKTYKVALLTVTGGTQSTLPDGNKYMGYVSGRVQTSSAKCAARYVKPNKAKQNSVDTVLKDPFNKPVIDAPVITFKDGSIHVYADSTFNVNKFELTYLKMPVEMSVFDNISCELPEFLQPEIVNLAAELLLEEIESKRLQTNMIINQKQ